MCRVPNFRRAVLRGYKDVAGIEVQGAGNVPVKVKRELNGRLWIERPVEAIPGDGGQAD